MERVWGECGGGFGVVLVRFRGLGMVDTVCVCVCDWTLCRDCEC